MPPALQLLGYVGQGSEQDGLVERAAHQHWVWHGLGGWPQCAGGQGPCHCVHEVQVSAGDIPPEE